MRNLLRFSVVFAIMAGVLSSCKKDGDDELIPCVDQIQQYEPFVLQNFVNNLQAQLPATNDRTYHEIVRTETYRWLMQGGDNIDSDNRCYSRTLRDWERGLNTDLGGPYCAGTTYFLCAVYDTTNAMNPGSFVSYAALSIGVKDAWDDSRGHVLALTGMQQDGVEIASYQDAQFNYTLVLRDDPSKVVGADQVQIWAEQRVLHEKVMVTVNTVPTRYLTEYECPSLDHPTFNANKSYAVMDSDRDRYPFIALAPRDLDNFYKYFFADGEDFEKTYEDILESFGYGDIDLSDPDNIPYIFVCVRAIYKTNDPEFAGKTGFKRPNQAQLNRLLAAISKQKVSYQYE